MVARFIAEFVEGSKVDSVFVVRSREMRAARNGDAYLALELSDRSGSIPGVLFRPRPEAAAIPSGSVVTVRGTVTVFRGKRRVSVDVMLPADSWAPEELLGTSERPREELVAELRGLATSVSEPSLRRLLRATFSDGELFERFCTCPATAEAHHAFVSGLLEHTLSVATLCGHAAERHAAVDRDLLLTAALVHDVGVVDSLEFASGATATDQGILVGHQVLGVLRVRDCSRSCRLPDATRLRLEHAILSHHAEAGSEPSTIEATILARVDSLDACISGFADAVKAATRLEEGWTGSRNRFGHPLLAPSAA